MRGHVGVTRDGLNEFEEKFADARPGHLGAKIGDARAVHASEPSSTACQGPAPAFVDQAAAVASRSFTRNVNFATRSNSELGSRLSTLVALVGTTKSALPMRIPSGRSRRHGDAGDEQRQIQRSGLGVRETLLFKVRHQLFIAGALRLEQQVVHAFSEALEVFAPCAGMMTSHWVLPTSATPSRLVQSAAELPRKVRSNSADGCTCQHLKGPMPRLVSPAMVESKSRTTVQTWSTLVMTALGKESVGRFSCHSRSFRGCEKRDTARTGRRA